MLEGDESEKGSRLEGSAASADSPSLKDKASSDTEQAYPESLKECKIACLKTACPRSAGEKGELILFDLGSCNTSAH